MELEGGRCREIVVPVRAARILRDDPPPFPMGEEAAFDAIHDVEARCAFAAVTDMLSRRDHSEQELRRKLLALGYREVEIAQAIERARDRRFVDDGRFAGYFIEERIRRGWGPRKIEAELRCKGIDPGDVEGFPEGYFGDGRELELAEAALRRKPVPADRPYDRLLRHLLSRGFSCSAARRAVEHRLEDDASS